VAREACRAVEPARQALREVPVGPLTLAPEGGSYAFEGELLVGPLLRGRADVAMLLARPEGLATYDTDRTVRRRVDYAPGQLLRGRLSLFVDGHCGCGGPLPSMPTALYVVAA
jgi:hypothetical protein